MKKQNCWSILCVVLFLISGCSNPNSEVKVNSDWQDKIAVLNEQYRAYIDSQASKPQRAPQADDKDSADEKEDDKEQTELKVDKGEIAYWDAVGVLQGARAGAVFGGAGALVGAIVAGAGLSVASYVVQSNEAMVMYAEGDLSYGAPDFEQISLIDIDRREPVYVWTLSDPMNMAIGVDVGPIHNYIVSELLNNPLYCSHNFDNVAQLKSDIIDVIRNNSFFSIDVSDELCNIENSTMFENEIPFFTDRVQLDEYKVLLREQIVDLTECLDIAFSLDSFLLYSYANQYTNIINEAYENGALSQEEAFAINATISVGCYSRMLWRPYLPDPSYESQRLVFDLKKNQWTLCNETDISYLLAGGAVSLVGIPHFVHGRLAELYFYSDELQQYGINLESFASENSTLSFSEETIYVSMLPFNMDLFNAVTPGVYVMREVPQTNASIYSIALY